ncbi:MAG TPA: bifunctional diguanylate cyclase/phosphodiesterase [Gaiellaceae bacterium]|nr:bifunctional diguanylate cyclase/phosphodiesterase [Gaiellaceae bacterium]
MTIRSRRHLTSTFAWALSLAALVLVSSLLTAVLRETPNYVLAILVIFAFVAAASGVLLNWRLGRAHSEALRDPLTGLPNRALLDDRIEQALRQSRRSGEPFTLIVVDLDGFKDVNDVRGHRAGDAVLRTLAQRFEAILRESDTVARVGGDEFVVLSMGTGSDDTAQALVGRLRHALRRPFRVDGATVEIDGSIGWAVFPEDGATADELLARADGQMYATKRDTADDSVFMRRGVDAGVVRDVETALERNELVVLYQPILDLATGATHAAEALVRRVLADGGLVPPAEFVPHVERTPLARELTFLVLSDALRSAQLWSEAGHDLGVSVNVPYRLLDDPQFVDGLASMLRSSSIRPTRVTLEVVPSGPGAGAELDEDVLGRLAKLGVRLSLDDGGRAASFAALRVLPLDELKIDGGFVHGLGRSATDAALVHGMVDIGHALGLSVVAEGVETRAAWNVLTDWGCDFAQGFYVAGPRPANELVDWLRGRWPAVA